MDWKWRPTDGSWPSWITPRAEVQRLAQVSGDPNMTEIMDDPTRDPHASLAREKDPELLGKYTDAEIKKKFKSQRDEAKPFTFGIPYQRGNEAMARSLNREAVRAKKPANHTAESVAHIKNAYARLYSTAWELSGRANEPRHPPGDGTAWEHLFLPPGSPWLPGQPGRIPAPLP